MTDKPTRFSELIGTVEPIAKPPQQYTAKPAEKVPNRRRINAQHHRPLPRKQGKKDISINLDGLPKHQFNALVAGHIHHQRIFDLHGSYVDDAIRYLDDKLSERQNYHLQYWLIIHGKGRHSPDYDRAPLKNAVIELLLQHPAVAALSAVRDADNNSGGINIAVHPKR